MKRTINLDDYFQPRSYQMPILDAFSKGYKRILAVLPRRAGKDLTCWNLMIEQAMRKPAIYWYILPTYAQARKVIWHGKLIDGRSFLDCIPKEVISRKKEQEMSIHLINGSLIQVLGSADIDRLMGSNPYGIIFSEYAMTTDTRVFPLLLPILRASDGWCIFISTPRGKNNFYELYNIALQNPDDWFCYRLSVEDTKHISVEDIKKDVDSGAISYDMAQQEYYCFPTGTKVLGTDKLIGIEKIAIGDMVISHSGRMRKVLKTYTQQYNGNLISIKSYGSYEPIVCTPDHPIRIYNRSEQKYEWKKAINITLEDRLVFPKLSLSSKSFISYDLCMVIAWYITEGSSFKNGLQFSLGTEQEVNRVSSLLKTLGYIPHQIFSKTGYNLVVYDVSIVDFMKFHCGNHASNKRIPFSLISGYEEQFFHELIKGDGCISIHKGHKRYVYTTISKTLAYQVQLLAHSIPDNLTAGITKRTGGTHIFPGKRICNAKDSYLVQIHTQGSRKRDSWMIRGKHSIAAKIKEIISVPYVGEVHNIKVQYDESYIVGGRSVHNCSFDMGISGVVFGTSVDRMRENNQIAEVPWLPEYPVHTSWDIGNDTTAICFFQETKTTVRIIDYYERSSENLEHYVNYIKSKPYTYGKHFFPHDMAVKEWAGPKFSRVEKARQLGIKATIVDSVSLEDGIEVTRSSLARIYIDEAKCLRLIKCMENYRYEWNDKRQVYSDKPLHNWASHGADSLRYLCLSLPKAKDGMTASDARKLRDEAIYGSGSNLPEFFRT
jgi:hypothetical protein